MDNSRNKFVGGKTEVEIITLVRLVREEDCEDSFSEIVRYVSSFIESFGKKYRIPGCDIDEIKQECLFALRFKAIEDFNPDRGKFKSFAVLCLKRHLFSLIKGNNQHKRRVLNESVSLDEDRSEDGDSLSLASLVSGRETPAPETYEKDEVINNRKANLFSKLSILEREVVKFYLQQYRYDEIVEEIRKTFPDKNISKKTIDNALVRARSKSREVLDGEDFYNV